MTEHKSMLCVGGPLAGQRYAVMRGNGFSVPVREDVIGQYDQPLTVAHTDYSREIFHTPQGDVSFWVPRGQSPLETITKLLETYEARLKGGR